MRRRRLLDSAILASMLRAGPIQGRADSVPPFWIAPTHERRVIAFLDGKKLPIDVTEISYTPKL